MKFSIKSLVFFIMFFSSIPYILSQETNSFDTTKNHKISAIIFPSRNPLNGWNIQFGGIDLFKTVKTDTLLRSSDLFAFFFYSQYKQYNIFLGSDIFLPNEKYYVRLETSFSYFPESYYSLYSDNNPDSSELIDYKINHIWIEPLKKVGGNLFAGFSLIYDRTYDFHFEDDGYFINDHYTDYNGEKVAGIGLVLKYDTRDNLIWVNKGKLIETSFQAFRKNEMNISNFSTFYIDYRQFFELNPELNHVLGFQIHYKYASQNTSFRYLPNNFLRAFHPNLFKDYNSFITRVEYRFKVYKAIHLAGFGGIGITFPKFFEIKNEKWRFNAGPGIRLRLKKDQPLFLGIDYGLSTVSGNLHVTLSSLF